MAVRPTLGFAGWASGFSGSLVITEPTSTKKAIGYKTNDVPASSEFNWAFNLAYQWQKYFDDGLVKGEVAVKSMVVSALAPTGASAIPGTIRVEGIANDVATTVGMSYAPGTIFKDSLTSAWAWFGVTGASLVPYFAKAFNINRATRFGQGIYRAFFTNPPVNNNYVALAGRSFNTNSPARTGAQQGNIVECTSQDQTYVEVRAWDGNGDAADVNGFISVVVIGP